MLYISELTSIPSPKQKINKSKPTLRHIIMKLQNIKNKENLKSGRKKMIHKGTASRLLDTNSKFQEMSSQAELVNRKEIKL